MLLLNYIDVLVDGEFIVEGNAVENLMRRVNIGDNESFAYLQKMLRRLGIEEELKRNKKKSPLDFKRRFFKEKNGSE